MSYKVEQMDYRTWSERQKEKAEIIKLNKEARIKRIPEEQLDVLDKRFGKGIGAKKERAKLLAQIKAEKDKNS